MLGGYLASGSFKLGSGVKHADVISAGAIIHDKHGPDLSITGRPYWIVLLLQPEDIHIEDDWESTGLAGSGSVSYSFENVFVPEKNTFNFSVPKSRSGPMGAPDTLMRKMVGVPLGAVRRVLDDVRELLAETGKSTKYQYQLKFGECEARYRMIRHSVYSSVERKMTLCSKVEDYQKIPATDRIESVAIAQIAFRDLLSISRDLYDLVGSRSVYRGSCTDQAMRDLVTICQHVMAQPVILQCAGASSLGEEAAFPFALGNTR